MHTDYAWKQMITGFLLLEPITTSSITFFEASANYDRLYHFGAKASINRLPKSFEIVL